jgi:hypothetical protein
MTMHYLYRILLPDGLAYIGRSKQPKLRFSEHCRADSYVGEAIRRHGRDNCVLQILCAGSEAYISDLEKRAIEKFNTHAPDGCNGGLSEAGIISRARGRALFLDSLRRPTNELASRPDAIFAPAMSPEEHPNCGWIEMTANTEGRHAIERIFPGWVFNWRQLGCPCEGWWSTVSHLPSLATACAKSLESELVDLNQLPEQDDAQLASLMARAAHNQGARATSFALGHRTGDHPFLR